MTVGALGLVAALALAAVFTAAGIAKLADRAGTRKAVREFGAPERLVAVLAPALPAAEIAVAILLLPVATREVGAAGALGLLGVFSAAIALSLVRGRTPDCHCFGQLHSAPASWKTLVRNGLLGAVAAGLLIAARDDAGPSPWGWLAERTLMEVAITISVVAAGTLVVAVCAALLALTRAYGRVLLRLEVTEQALRDAGIELAGDADVSVPELGLDPGTPAPHFEAQLTTGQPVTRGDLLAPGLPLLLVFTSPSCEPCHTLMPSVARWQGQFDDRLTIAVASAGEPGAIRGMEAEYGLRSAVVDTDLALSEAYLTTGTPSAVLIAPDGTIASYVAAGPDEIEALLDRVLSTSSDEGDAGLPVGSPAPELELRGIGDESVSLVDPAGNDTVLLFWNPGCGFCQAMLPGLLAWEQEMHGDSPLLVVVSSGGADETVADGFRSTVVLDPEFAVGEAFRAGGTPMAVTIDAQGRIASPLATGGEAVLAYLTRTGVEAGPYADVDRR